MRVLPVVSLVSLAVLAPSVARADDAPTDKQDAKALLASGLKLYQGKDYLGALAIFRDAYARFPSAKLLLNIGTTLSKLDRKAEAANAYQKYLDSPDADAAKKPEVAKVLAELDKAVGTLAISASAPGAEVQLAGGEGDDWIALPATLRAAPGDVVLRVRAKGYTATEVKRTASAGAKTEVVVSLGAVPVVAPPPPPPVTVAPVRAAAERAPLGVYLMGHVDIANKGAAGLLGATYDVLPHLEVQLAGLLGGTAGGYAGATVPILTGRVRPVVSVGMPVFVSHGARFAVRGAAGVEFVLDRRFAVYAEVGGEHVINREMNVVANLLVPALGVTGRFW